MKNLFGIDAKSLATTPAPISLTQPLPSVTTQHQKQELKNKSIRLPGLCKERTQLWFWVALILVAIVCL